MPKLRNMLANTSVYDIYSRRLTPLFLFKKEKQYTRCQCREHLLTRHGGIFDQSFVFFASNDCINLSVYLLRGSRESSKLPTYSRIQ